MDIDIDRTAPASGRRAGKRASTRHGVAPYGTARSDSAGAQSPTRSIASANQTPQAKGDGIAAPAAHSTNHAKARALLKQWLEEDANAADESLELLMEELDRHREPGQKLFAHH
jgi:hypothetical protein